MRGLGHQEEPPEHEDSNGLGKPTKGGERSLLQQGCLDHRLGPYFILIFRAMARSSSSRSCSRNSCEGWLSPPTAPKCPTPLSLA